MSLNILLILKIDNAPQSNLDQVSTNTSEDELVKSFSRILKSIVVPKTLDLRNKFIRLDNWILWWHSIILVSLGEEDKDYRVTKWEHVEEKKITVKHKTPCIS